MNIYKVGYSYAAKGGQLRNGALLIPATDIEDAHIKGTKAVAEQNLLYPSVNNITLYRAEDVAKDVNTKKK